MLSREPLDWAANRALLTGEGPRAWAEVGYRGLAVTLVHLSPHRPDHCERRRLGELRPVLDALGGRRSAGEPHVVMGDFNAVHPGQPIDESKLRPDDLHGYRENDNRMPHDVVNAMLDAGYADAAGDLGETGGTLDTIRRGLRVDYVFTFGAEAKAAWCETDRLATYASDHYPVGVEVVGGWGGG